MNSPSPSDHSGHGHGKHGACKHNPAKKSDTPSCCHGGAGPRDGEPGHDHHHAHHHDADIVPSASAKYFCPMCAGVESDRPGDCPMCGMALERNPAFVGGKKALYTCPMHPEVQQDHPRDCPKCGMALEAIQTGDDDAEEDEHELKQLSRKLWIGGALA